MTAPVAQDVHVHVTKEDDVDEAAIEGAVDNVLTESKKGYKTTEFWLVVIASIGTITDAIPAPHSKEGYIVAGLAIAYAISRGIAKLGIPHVEVKA